MDSNNLRKVRETKMLSKTELARLRMLDTAQFSVFRLGRKRPVGAVL
jgi:hypothetical protein